MKQTALNNASTNYVNLERLTFLVDGVFAITMTLLVLELHLPDESTSLSKSMGWLISILLGFVDVYVAYASWILWPNAVALWGNYRRKQLQFIGNPHVKKNVRT
jgi:uncharacterized membrane protein